MPSTSYRYNVTTACDLCRRLKIRCKKETHLNQSTKCNGCIKRNAECTYPVHQERRGPKPRTKEESPDNEKLLTSPSSNDPKLFPSLSQELVANEHELYKLCPDLSQEGIKPIVNNHDFYELCPDLSQEGIKLIANDHEFYELLPDLSQKAIKPVANEHELYELCPDLSHEEIKLVANNHEFYELLRDLSQKEIKLVANDRELFRDLSQEDISTSTTSSSCPYENNPGHYCHIG
ncbi:6139_t:CDS:1, partial [Racocetra fulgida]